MRVRISGWNTHKKETERISEVKEQKMRRRSQKGGIVGGKGESLIYWGMVLDLMIMSFILMKNFIRFHKLWRIVLLNILG